MELLTKDDVILKLMDVSEIIRNTDGYRQFSNKDFIVGGCISPQVYGYYTENIYGIFRRISI